MRRCCRMGDKALRVAEIVRNIDELQCVEKAETGLLAAGHVKADEAAALFHLPLGKVVLRMARQSGVEHPADFRMTFKIVGDGSGGAALPLDPQRESLKTLEQQPRVEWAQGRPGVPVKRAKVVLDEFLRREDRAAEATPLAVDVLGRRIDDDIGAQCQGLLQERR